MHCQNCGNKIEKHDKFCGQCGTEVIKEAVLTCSNCGEELKADQKFCSNCGHERSSDKIVEVEGDLSPEIPQFYHTNRGDESFSLQQMACHWSLALRKLHSNGNEEGFLQNVTYILRQLKNRADMQNVQVEFEEWLLVILLNLHAENRYPVVISELSKFLEHRIKKYKADPENYTFSKSKLFLKVIYSWPYQMYPQLFTFDMPEENLSQCCLQTAREDFYILRMSTTTRRKFINEETIRIESGIYTDQTTSSMRQLLSKLERFLQKDEAKLEEYGHEAEAKAIGQLISPLSVPEIAQHLASTASTLNISYNPFSYEPLGDWEQEQLSRLISGEYNIDDMVSFLEGRYQDLNHQNNKMTLNDSVGGIGIRNLEGHHFILLFAHFIVTRLLNMLKRKQFILEKNAGKSNIEIPQEFPYLSKSAFNDPVNSVRKAMAKNDSEMKKAFFPDEVSLYHVEFKAADQTVNHSSTRKSSVKKSSNEQPISNRKPNSDDLIAELQEHVNQRRDAAKNGKEVLKGLLDIKIGRILDENLSIFGLTENYMDNNFGEERINWLVEKGYVY